MPPGNTNILTTTTNVVADPEAAAQQLQRVLEAANVVPIVREIGLALLYLLALIELYRLWFRGTGTDFAVLAAKVAIINFLITTPTINDAAEAIYTWTLHGAFSIIGQTATGAASQIVDAFAAIGSVAPHFGSGPGGAAAAIIYIVTNFVSALLLIGLFLFYLIVVAVILAIYVFALLSSAVVYTLCIVLIPLLFPMFLWERMANFGGRWVSTILHALFMPLVASVLVYAAVALGLVTPIRMWASCMTGTSNTSAGTTLACLGQTTGALIGGIIAGIAAILLMFSIDGLVSNFFPAVEVTTAGLIAAKFAVGGGLERAAAAVMGRRGPSAPPGAGSAGGGDPGAAGAAGGSGGGSRAGISSAPPGRSLGSAAMPSRPLTDVRVQDRDTSMVSPGDIEWALDQADLRI